MLEIERRCLGAFMGFALGDALGAPYEGGVLERALWAVIGRTIDLRWRYTDDTQMMVDVANCLLDDCRIDQDKLATSLARNYKWSRGYGPGAAKTLRLVRKGVKWRIANRAQYVDGSLGNGAAIRSVPIAIINQDQECLRNDTLRAAEVTHAHIEAKESAWVFTCVIAGLLNKQPINDSMLEAKRHCDSEVIQARVELCLNQFLCKSRSPKEIVEQIGSRVLARESVFSAIVLASDSIGLSYKELFARVLRCGGDVDSICAMAGAMWGAANGIDQLPNDLLRKLEGADNLKKLAQQLIDVRFDSPGVDQ
jgi:poly(ADP-ribose) glycohydrolase ARH3